MNKTAYATIGPVPVSNVALIWQQTEEQGWTVRFIAHAGMVMVQDLISVGKPQPIPAFGIFACKDYIDGKEPKPPVFNIRAGEPRPYGG